MASNLIPFPCLAGICLLPFFFRFWLFTVRFIGFSALISSPAHLHNALLGGHGTRPPCQAATGYKLLQHLSNRTKILQNLSNGKKTLHILLHGTKILQDSLKGGRISPPVSPSMLSCESMTVNRGRDKSTPYQKRSSTARPNICRRENCFITNCFGGGLQFQGFPGSRGKENPGFFRVFQGFQGLLATLCNSVVNSFRPSTYRYGLGHHILVS